MRAARCHAYGHPADVVVVEDLPAPVPAAGEVLVRVEAAAVNFSDVLVIGNAYQRSVPLPFTPGSEFAGTVVETAPGIERPAVGDVVMGAGIAGAFAEEVAVSAAALIVVPSEVEPAEAVACGVAHSTAYHALRSVAEVESGEWVVVLGAAGGVGLAAVELAHILGCRVLAAASTPAKLEVCRGKGADAVVDYENEDLKARIRELTGGGADVVIDPVGGRYSEPALRSTRWGARFVCVGFASGEIPRIPLNLVLLKGVTVMGLELWGFSINHPDLLRRDRAELMELLAAGRVRAHISAVHPLSEAAAALQEVADRRSTGKVLIDPTR